MDQERHETYERIPWETLEKPKNDRQWLVIAVSGAVAIGALAYSFMRNQPVTVSATVPVVAEATAPATIPPAPPTITAPMVIAEADLYAVDPERVLDRVAAHAEWFVVEYFSADASEESISTLERLLPKGIPLPVVPEGRQVFVDWVGVQSVSEQAPLTYSVEVAVRSMASDPSGGFVRQPTRIATVQVVLGADGLPRVSAPPMIGLVIPPEPELMDLGAVPSHISAQLGSLGEVVGGSQRADGRWDVVVMVVGPDGVTRPTLMIGS